MVVNRVQNGLLNSRKASKGFKVKLSKKSKCEHNFFLVIPIDFYSENNNVSHLCITSNKFFFFLITTYRLKQMTSTKREVIKMHCITM
jgi:hypothetical protein